MSKRDKLIKSLGLSSRQPSKSLVVVDRPVIKPQNLNSNKRITLFGEDNKQSRGQFYTVGNPFEHKVFLRWAALAGLPQAIILEPFAGQNSLIDHLRDLNLCLRFKSYDIEPRHKQVESRDTIGSFPQGFDVCITNPPWLAKNTATREGLEYQGGSYDDLYKQCLNKCLKNCKWVAILIPGSFIKSGLFTDRLTDFITLNSKLFSDTDHPVGLALFGPNKTNDVNVWFNDDRIGLLSEIKANTPQPDPDGVKLEFNNPEGNIGLIALDNTKEASIRFCHPDELGGYKIDQSSRSITRIKTPTSVNIDKLNSILSEFRKKTGDTLMCCYRGIRLDGQYRRRLDWNIARGIIHIAISTKL